MPKSPSPPSAPNPLAFAWSNIVSKRHPPKDTRPSFHGQSILITGANTGLGLEAAIKFARGGAARLILGVRSLSKGETAAAHIRSILAAEKQNSQNPDAKSSSSSNNDDEGSATNIEVWELDMLSYPSILTFATRAKTELAEGLDVAVLNAGVMAAGFATTAYGWERTMQVNLLSTVLLGMALMPALKKTAAAAAGEQQQQLQQQQGRTRKAVLEIVGSSTHYLARLEPGAREAGNVLELYSAAEKFPAGMLMEHYNVSKLFLMYAQKELVEIGKATTPKESEVEVVVVCPGPTVSDLGRDASAWYFRMGKFVIRHLMFRTTEEGSRTYISGVTLGEKGNGRFWKEDAIQEPAHLLVGSENERFQQKVWHDIVEALRKDVPEIDQLTLRKTG